jgi:hypothetical protein
VDVWYGMDFDDATWYYVGRIATSGLTSLQVGGPTGIQARFFRLKFQGAKHPTDPYQAPMILFYDSEVMRVLPATYGYGFQLDLSSAVGNLSPIQQIQYLKQLIDPRVTRGLYEFAYQPSPDSTPNTFYGRISRINGQEATGLALRHLPTGAGPSPSGASTGRTRSWGCASTKSLTTSRTSPTCSWCRAGHRSTSASMTLTS